ncbi:MAG: hypothetical protein NT076_02975 [Candidatus Pacearchaeota archaeon]|nr:hypothetical protein [Candidatus Pacearchaeota archaeon]
MQKKGQAAMEFLMTYGWAILAAVIAIGALAYFGVFSPSKYVPNVCTLNTPFGCDEYKVSSTGIELVIRNGAGDSVVISNITITGCGSDIVPHTVADGATLDTTVNCAISSKFRGDITINYKKAASILDQTATGAVSGKP